MTPLSFLKVFFNKFLRQIKNQIGPADNLTQGPIHVANSHLVLPPNASTHRGSTGM